MQSHDLTIPLLFVARALQTVQARRNLDRSRLTEMLLTRRPPRTAGQAWRMNRGRPPPQTLKAKPRAGFPRGATYA
jgi:hypothetical protein